MRNTILCYSIPLSLTVMLALGKKQMVMIERAFSNKHTVTQRDTQPIQRDTLLHPESYKPICTYTHTQKNTDSFVRWFVGSFEVDRVKFVQHINLIGNKELTINRRTSIRSSTTSINPQ